jgi:two-component system, sensor histidine kinase LadS
MWLAPLFALFLTVSSQAVTLDGKTSRINLDPSLIFFLDPTGQLKADQVEAMPDTAFAAVESGRSHLIGNGALWLRFDVINNQPDTHWRLIVPLPGVDEVALYYRKPGGQWAVQQAGDRLAISAWSQPARYPVFSLPNTANQQVRYFVKIEHERIPYSVMPRIVTDAELLTTELSDHLLLGVYFGLAALLVMLALANTLAYRDAGFGTYALYIALFTVGQAMFTGVAALYWWPESPGLNRGLIFVLTLAGAAATWFVRTVVMPKRFFKLLDWAVLTLIALLPLAGLFDILWQTPQTFSAFNLLVSIDLVLLLVVVMVAVFAGDRHSRWIVYGFSPVLLATLVPLLRNYGVLQSSFWTEYALLIGSAIEVPILFYGLHRRMAQGRGMNARASGLRYADPLTGVYTARIYNQKLKQLITATPRHHQPFAMLLIELTNYSDLLKKYNRETADRALVMAAARIRGLARSVDTVARLGDMQFGLLMEGPVSASDANDVATKILAAGLRATNELPERDPLRFHIALGHHDEPDTQYPAQAEGAMTQLLTALKEMNDGSGKAIRVVKI